MKGRWYLGEVVQVLGEGDRDDGYDGERLRIFVDDLDKKRNFTDLPWAFPLLPKMLHIMPKVGETVLTLITNEEQRYYLGPIISQPQFFYKCYGDNSTSLLEGGTFPALDALSHDGNSEGAYGDKDDVSIYGRDISDILLGDNDVRIRCGAREGRYKDITFNRNDPAFMHLKYYQTTDRSPFTVTKKKNEDSKLETVKSTATIMAQEINLISTSNSEGFTIGADSKIEHKSHMLSDEMMKKIIEEAHPLPYGDKLIEFLRIFVKAFLNHQHNWGPKEPVPDDNVKELKEKASNIVDDVLSRNVRIA